MVQIFSLDIKATLQLDNPYSSYCTLLTFPFQNVGSRTVPSIEVLLSHGRYISMYTGNVGWFLFLYPFIIACA